MATNVVGLDPGSTESSFVELDPRGIPVARKSAANAEVRAALRDKAGDGAVLAVEWMRPRGMPTSQEEIDACVELGRMIEAWSEMGGRWEKVSRLQAKMHVCGRANATDANIRQALIDLHGGADLAIGGKKCQRCKGTAVVTRLRTSCPVCPTSPGWRIPPGPLNGLRGDQWAAMAIAVTARERMNERSG